MQVLSDSPNFSLSTIGRKSNEAKHKNRYFADGYSSKAHKFELLEPVEITQLYEKRVNSFVKY